MDEKSLEMLEFPKVRQILADYTSFPVSREMALALAPLSDREEVSIRLAQSAEARWLLSEHPAVSIGAVHDVREAVEIARRGKSLDAHTLLDVRATVASVDRLRNSLHKLSDQLPNLWSIAHRFVALPHLEREIGRCINESGEMLDSASPKLVEIKQKLRDTRQHLLNRLEGIVRAALPGGVLQDALITERAGRYVIPVKVEFKKEMRGIIHDVSNTGATVFIEPWRTVELGNELRQLSLEEEREIQRILAELSSQVASEGSAIILNVNLVAEIDLALAKARYAERVGAVEADVTAADASGSPNSTVLKLVNARHPLLRGKAVPLTVELGKGFSSLIITGPNTGGKTVALKTIGLMSLMTLSGLPIPAEEGSIIPVFDGIFADIGDQQSIEQTLSTFSWHIGNIVRIVNTSTTGSLVLLDELGTSTDPAEGSALAQAILLHFMARRTTVVATTHFGELKAFAHTTPGMQNASMEFDPVTLRPTYHLMLGIPGGSNALATASNLGLPAEIVAAARGMLTQGAAGIEELLADLAAERRASRLLRAELEKERAEVAEAKLDLEGQMARIKDQERDVLRDARDRVSREAAELQREIRAASAELKRARTKESLEVSRRTLDAVREQLAGPAWQAGIKPDGEDRLDEAVAVGDRVRMIETGLEGTVSSVSEKDNRVEITAGQVKIRVDREEVEKIAPPGPVIISRGYVVKREAGRARPPLELDLRGRRAEEVEPELDSYLNDASLSGMSMARIIHGYGTGTVRQMVRDMLASHPLVKSFRKGERGEGGDGVTVVEL